MLLVDKMTPCPLPDPSFLGDQLSRLPPVYEEKMENLPQQAVNQAACPTLFHWLRSVDGWLVGSVAMQLQRLYWLRAHEAPYRGPMFGSGNPHHVTHNHLEHGGSDTLIWPPQEVSYMWCTNSYLDSSYTCVK